MARRNLKRTERGFIIYSEIRDSYKNEVRVVQSSKVGGPYVWIFCHHPKDPDKATSPHLSIGQAKRIRDALTKFIDGVE